MPQNRFTRIVVGGLLVATALIVLTALMLSDWERYAATKNMTAYIDLNHAEHEGDQVTVWVLWNHNTDQTNEDSVPYRSQRLRMRYDCKQQTAQVIEGFDYPLPMTEGEPLHHWEQPWPVSPVPPARSVGRAGFEAACGEVA